MDLQWINGTDNVAEMATKSNVNFNALQEGVGEDIATAIATATTEIETYADTVSATAKTQAITDTKTWAKETFRNDNLLINGYLKNAINQDGLTTYQETTGNVLKTSIDMWFVRGATLTKTSSGWSIQKYGSVSATGFYHHSELAHLLGETLTFSVKVDGEIKKVTGVLSTSVVSLAFTGGTLYFYKPSTKEYVECALTYTDSNIHPMEWFKIEKGSVNTDCPITGKDELLKCLPYYWKSGNGTRGALALDNKTASSFVVCNVRFPVNMRINPTITLVSLTGVANDISYWANGTPLGGGSVIVNDATLSFYGFNSLYRATAFPVDYLAFHVVADARLY